MKALRHIENEFFKRYILSVTIMLVVVGGILILLYYSEVQAQGKIGRADEISSVQLRRKIITIELKSIITDLLVASQHQEMRMFLQGMDDERRETLCDGFTVLVQYKAIYDQIRLIDTTGLELIRVDYNSGVPSEIPENELQMKSHRYYFTETMKISRGEVYVSEFDLNIENGEIEIPLKPMIRFGTPVFDDHGIKRGIVVINYLGANLIDAISREFARSAGEIFLLNSEGYWLLGPSPEEEWGFMYNDGATKTLAATDAALWEKISQAESGQFNWGSDLITHTTLYPLSNYRDFDRAKPDLNKAEWFYHAESSYYWILLSRLGGESFSVALASLRLKLSLIFLVFIFVGGVVMWYYTEKVLKAEEERTRLLSSLQAKNADLEQIVHISSHDLRSPLVNIAGFAGVVDRNIEQAVEMLSGPGKEDESRGQLQHLLEIDTRKAVEHITKGCQRMGTLISGLLRLTHLGRMDVEIQRLDMNALLGEIKRDLSYLIEQAGVQVEIKDLPPCCGDRLQIGQVFSNLLDNALKYLDAERSGIVRVSGRQTGRLVEYCVEDNGIGIAPENYDLVFQLFHRMNPSKTTGEGVGLTLIKKIIDRHGGQIRLESKPGAGSKFYVSLPEKAGGEL